jgi:precorrin-6Y C5,15-methyltransferase (decarboxylating)
MLAALEALLPEGTRVVANAVTLEAEVLLIKLHERKGGDLFRIEIAQAGPLGDKTGWKAAYPVVQWSGVL